ncbi:toll-like receptor 2 type-2 [Cetorhinus maximus]
MAGCCATPKRIDTSFVNCSRFGYPFSPCILGPDVEMLDLSYNNITIIQQRSFQNLTKLKNLFLQFNHITVIEPGSFAKNSELSEHDSPWVKNKLLVQLENNDPPYRICIHERDFKPGMSIINNIIDCVSKSYKTVFILSKHFVQSEWCHYEFFFAHQQAFDDKKDSLILLLLEPIPKNSIPDRFCKLRKLMNRNTYLEWPQNESQQSFFWKRLKAVLSLDFHSCSSQVTRQEIDYPRT